VSKRRRRLTWFSISACVRLNACEPSRQDRAQRDKDRENVNDLLQDRAERWRKQIGSRGNHRCDRQTHTFSDRWQGNRLGSSIDEDGIGESIEPVNGQDDIGCLGGGCRPPRGEATPTPAAARTGASLIPSPTMIVAARGLGPDDSKLVARSQSAKTVSTPKIRPTMLAMSARSPVTNTTEVNTVSRRLERIHCPLRSFCQARAPRAGDAEAKLRPQVRWPRRLAAASTLWGR
jgi:hypothetical protein